MRKIALFAAAMLFAGTALAGRCPSEWKKIDEAMAKNPKLSAVQMADAKKARSESEVFHKAGKHAEAMTEVDKAKKILELK